MTLDAPKINATFEGKFETLNYKDKVCFLPREGPQNRLWDNFKGLGNLKQFKYQKIIPSNGRLRSFLGLDLVLYLMCRSTLLRQKLWKELIPHSRFGVQPQHRFVHSSKLSKPRAQDKFITQRYILFFLIFFESSDSCNWCQPSIGKYDLATQHHTPQATVVFSICYWS